MTTKPSAIGIAFCFVVIGLGAWTRLADAGLGCPDWPGCYGFVTFPTTMGRNCNSRKPLP